MNTEAKAALKALLANRGFATYGELIVAAGVERGHGEEKALRSVINDLNRALKSHDVAVIDMYGLGYAIPAADMEEAGKVK